MATKTYAVDFETYYDNELSVTVQGAVNYARHTQIYMVSIYGPGVEYVGDVEKAPWEEIAGCHWVSHNAGFDQAVFNAAKEKDQEWYEIFAPLVWDCTADLCAYLGIPRSLANAVKEVFGITLDKAMRGTAKGKHWPEDFTPEQQTKMAEYGLRDAKYCWQLWEDLSLQWIESERLISRITRHRAHQGVLVDRAELVKDIERLEEVKTSSLRNIPWYAETGVVRSTKKIAEYCLTSNIPVPVSTAEKSEEAEVWIEQYGDAHPIIGALRDYSKANRLQRIVEGMLDRIMPNGRMNFGLKYFGAHTGRWSGTDGLNMQNPNKEPKYGVDIRARIVSAPGKKFIIGDLAQIEPRCTAWLVNDCPMLKALRDGFGIYEAFAKGIGLWIGEAGTMKKTDKDLYALAKAQVLALGYGAGAAKFILMAKIYCDLDLSLDAAKEIVTGYRIRNWRVTNEWGRLEGDMRLSQRKGLPSHVITLPSGRELTYSRLEFKGTSKDGLKLSFKVLHAHPGRDKRHEVYWGGKLFENVVQATARDVLAYVILNLEGAGIPVLWSAHDEVICEVPQDFDTNCVKTIMTQTPPWLEGLVLDAEVIESQHYLK